MQSWKLWAHGGICIWRKGTGKQASGASDTKEKGGATCIRVM
jgi:hypothetical protein